MPPPDDNAALTEGRRGRELDAGPEPERVKVTFSLHREVVDTLRSLAKERGITMTEVLRQAVNTEKFLNDAQKEGDEIQLYNSERKITRQLLLR